MPDKCNRCGKDHEMPFHTCTPDESWKTAEEIDKGIELARKAANDAKDINMSIEFRRLKEQAEKDAERIRELEQQLHDANEALAACRAEAAGKIVKLESINESLATALKHEGEEREHTEGRIKALEDAARAVVENKVRGPQDIFGSTCAYRRQDDIDALAAVLEGGEAVGAIEKAKLEGYEKGLDELTPGIRKQEDRIKTLEDAARAVVERFDQYDIHDLLLQDDFDTINDLAAVLEGGGDAIES